MLLLALSIQFVCFRERFVHMFLFDTTIFVLTCSHCQEFTSTRRTVRVLWVNSVQWNPSHFCFGWTITAELVLCTPALNSFRMTRNSVLGHLKQRPLSQRNLLRGCILGFDYSASFLESNFVIISEHLWQPHTKKPGTHKSDCFFSLRTHLNEHHKELRALISQHILGTSSHCWWGVLWGSWNSHQPRLLEWDLHVCDVNYNFQSLENNDLFCFAVLLCFSHVVHSVFLAYFPF